LFSEKCLLLWEDSSSFSRLDIHPQAAVGRIVGDVRAAVQSLPVRIQSNPGATTDALDGRRNTYPAFLWLDLIESRACSTLRGAPASGMSASRPVLTHWASHRAGNDAPDASHRVYMIVRMGHTGALWLKHMLPC
jgi:hypothetical protein